MESTEWNKYIRGQRGKRGGQRQGQKDKQKRISCFANTGEEGLG